MSYDNELGVEGVSEEGGNARLAKITGIFFSPQNLKFGWSSNTMTTYHFSLKE